jgi:hypothetical protein
MTDTPKLLAYFDATAVGKIETNYGCVRTLTGGLAMTWSIAST